MTVPTAPATPGTATVDSTGGGAGAGRGAADVEFADALAQFLTGTPSEPTTAPGGEGQVVSSDGDEAPATVPTPAVLGDMPSVPTIPTLAPPTHTATTPQTTVTETTVPPTGGADTVPPRITAGSTPGAHIAAGGHPGSGPGTPTDSPQAPSTGTPPGTAPATPAPVPAATEAQPDSARPAATDTPAPTVSADHAPTAPSPATGPVVPTPLNETGPADARQGPVAQQVVRQVAVLRGSPDGVYTMTVQVTPEELGPVAVHVSIDRGALDLVLRSGTEPGRAALAQALPDLRRELEAAGLLCNRIEVDPDSEPATWFTAQQDAGGGHAERNTPDRRARSWMSSGDQGDDQPVVVEDQSSTSTGVDVRI